MSEHQTDSHIVKIEVRQCCTLYQHSSKTLCPLCPVWSVVSVSMTRSRLDRSGFIVNLQQRERSKGNTISNVCYEVIKWELNRRHIWVSVWWKTQGKSEGSTRLPYGLRFSLLQRIKRKLVGEEGRCRCYQRQRGTVWGNWSLSHTRWNCHIHWRCSL